MSKPDHWRKYALLLFGLTMTQACAPARAPAPRSLDEATARVVLAWQRQDLDALDALVADERRERLGNWQGRIAVAFALWTPSHTGPTVQDVLGPRTALVLVELTARDGAAIRHGRLVFGERDGRWWLLDL